MKVATLLRPLVTAAFWSKVIQICVACLLSGLILKTVVANVSEHEPATVVVHVIEPNVELSIDGIVYHSEEQTFDPIVLELAAGAHKIEMTRGTFLLYEESFDIKGGEELVLTASAPPL